jgi:hypothetical protein
MYSLVELSSLRQRALCLPKTITQSCTRQACTHFRAQELTHASCTEDNSVGNDSQQHTHTRTLHLLAAQSSFAFINLDNSVMFFDGSQVCFILMRNTHLLM